MTVHSATLVDKLKIVVFNHNGEQEKESIIGVRVGTKNPSLVNTICHHLASLVMPNGDPQDEFFYPTLTLMIDSYNLDHFML